MMKHPEAELQKQVLTKLFREYPAGIPFHVPNGEKRDARTGYYLKLMGTLAGVHDLPVVRPGSRIGWLEIKDKGKKLTAVQVDFHARILVLGHESFVIDDIEQLNPIIKKWLIEDAKG